MGLLDGKKALIAGVANKDSIAWGMARALHAQGAEIAFTCLKSNVRRLKKLAPGVESDLIFPCDVQSDEEIARAFDCLKEAFDGELHILVHSIAYADIDDLGGEFVRTTRSGWN
ncbi:SDR family oxidoreductase, partial [bacterium]|nr:SDR family oxidoreductase [bacterium]